VRGEIEQMQAEKKELSKRVAFATLKCDSQRRIPGQAARRPAFAGSRFRNGRG